MTGYQTKQDPIAISGVADLIIRSLLDRQQFFDPLGAAAHLGISSAAWPLFGLSWPSGVHLAARLALRPVNSLERVLELGCGLGLASLVGHRRGVDMTASDCHPLAASFLRENSRLNHLTPIKYRHAQWGLLPLALPLHQADPDLPLAGLFDLIIASDVLYERDDAGHLANYINYHAAPAAEVWIVDPNRGNRAVFCKHMTGLGYALHEENLSHKQRPDAAAYKGRALVFLKAAY
ncbi:MAG: methyltransferase domain-containing protein [Rhizobacter sp.]